MEQHDALIGLQLANYRIERLLGRGGMARVYFGWDVNLDRPVAVKVIDERYRGNPVYTERFVREARSVATWRHPNILQVYYAGEEEGLSFFVMEYIRGLDLEHWLRSYRQRGRGIPITEILRIGWATANALDYAHQHGVIHRDVKPANVIVAEDGRVVLTDFGLALNVSHGTLGEVFGSPLYIAPEQARNSADAVPQSDLYALGVMLYEMLVGQPPFDDPSPTTLALKHLSEAPPAPTSLNPALTLEIEQVLLRALAKSPRERYPTGSDLMTALSAAVAASPQDTAPATLPLPVTDSGTQSAAVALPLEASNYGEADASEFGSSAPGYRTTPFDPNPTPPSRSVLTPPLRGNKLAFATFGCAAVVLLTAVGLFLGLIVALNRGRGAQAQVSPSLPVAQTAVAILPAQDTPIPAAETQAPVPETGSSTEPAATEEPAPVETAAEAPAAGKQDFMLYYDNTSLYLKNLSDENLWINGLAFERVETGGEFRNKFSGAYWGEIYPTLRSEWCMVVEIYGEPEHLTPPQCNRRHLVVRTPTRDQDFIFWTKTNDSKEFRVLWQGKEVGRCRIQKGLCEFSIP